MVWTVVVGLTDVDFRYRTRDMDEVLCTTVHDSRMVIPGWWTF